MSLFRKTFLKLSLITIILSILLILIIVLVNFPVFLIIFLLIYFTVVFILIYLYSRSVSASFDRLVKNVQSGEALLPNYETENALPADFRSLEKAMQALTLEVGRRLEQAKSEGSRLEAILNGMSEAVFAMDRNLNLHLVNPKARELFKIDSRDIKGISLLEVTRSTELVDTARKAISSGVPFETGLTFHTGAEQHFQVYASPLIQRIIPSDAEQGKDNSSNGAVLVMQEITRLVKLERVRKDFVANVSHELRTPIQVIKGFSETLLESDDITDKNQIIHFMEIINRNAGIMENLTNDLLILSSLENNTVNTRDMEEVNISSLIKEAVYSVEHQAKKKQIEIIVICHKELKMQLYGSLMIQALINLIDNGIKYSHFKSKIWINAFRGKTDDNELIFEVRDKGIGIPAEHQERIFERFYRVDRARSRMDGGTGLGLSIVRHIALLHRGNAEVESHAGEGSIFRIIVPSPNHPNHNHPSPSHQKMLPNPNHNNPGTDQNHHP